MAKLCTTIQVWRPIGAICTVGLLLVACGGSDNGDSITTGTGQGNGGSGVLLQLAQSDSKRLTFATSVQQDVAVGENIQSQSINTVVVRDVSLSGGGDSYAIETLPELVSFSPEELQPEVLQLDRTLREYTALGGRTSDAEQDTLQAALILDSLSMPALTFSHPAIALSVGTEWIGEGDASSIMSSVRATVTELSSDVIVINHVIDTLDDSQGRYEITGSMIARYSVPSLLLEQADVDINIRNEQELYVNGVLQTVVDTTRVSQVITEVIQ